MVYVTDTHSHIHPHRYTHRQRQTQRNTHTHRETQTHIYADIILGGPRKHMMAQSSVWRHTIMTYNDIDIFKLRSYVVGQIL